MALGITFALAMAFLALAPVFIDALSAAEMQIEWSITVGLLVMAPAVFLFCVVTAVPLIFLLRLLQLGGDWMRQRHTTH